MPATIQLESGNLYRVNASGILRKAEMEKVQAEAVQGIARAGKVRFLFILEQFEGWERGEDWSDMGFYETHGEKIDRIGIVGEEKWRDPALMFAGAGLRKAPVRYFLPAEIPLARAWLSQ